jgi:hypothetical protein
MAIGEVTLCIRCLVTIVKDLYQHLEGTIQKRNDDVIWFTSGYGGNTQKPFITMESSYLDMPVQMGLEVAKKLLENLWGVIEGAETDAFIVEYFSKELGLDHNQVGALLIGFRTWREKHQ